MGAAILDRKSWGPPSWIGSDVIDAKVTPILLTALQPGDYSAPFNAQNHEAKLAQHEAAMIFSVLQVLCFLEAYLGGSRLVVVAQCDLESLVAVTLVDRALVELDNFHQ